MTIRPTMPAMPSAQMINPYEPKSSYVPLSDVAFAPAEIVMPHELPPQTVPYPVSWFSYLAGAPSIMTIYENRRNHDVKF